jgi:hypothetical protein
VPPQTGARSASGRPGEVDDPSSEPVPGPTPANQKDPTYQVAPKRQGEPEKLLPVNIIEQAKAVKPLRLLDKVHEFSLYFHGLPVPLCRGTPD